MAGQFRLNLCQQRFHLDVMGIDLQNFDEVVSRGGEVPAPLRFLRRLRQLRDKLTLSLLLGLQHCRPLGFGLLRRPAFYSGSFARLALRLLPRYPLLLGPITGFPFSLGSFFLHPQEDSFDHILEVFMVILHSLLSW